MVMYSRFAIPKWLVAIGAIIGFAIIMGMDWQLQFGAVFFG